MDTYPRVRSVEALPGKLLRVTFDTGATRYYDCNPLLNLPAFRMLRNEAFFGNVRADPHGYGVLWSDDIDLAESELWIHGTIEVEAQPEGEYCEAG